ncbi:MAG: choice-of-anchor L domain-containing protein [Acidobacteria bacterium]|nr:choice-of-anchor L domain-containing protein [Acidobacteriota bacterium]
MKAAGTLAALGVILFCVQPAGRAQDGDALPYSTGYLVTGDYAVGSVALPSASPSASGVSTGTISMSGVPANADILAAFLYWQTVQVSSVERRQIADSVRFRGRPIMSVRVKSTRQLLPGNTGQCFPSRPGPPLGVTVFRADVLRLLPPQMDVNGDSTGKLLVNDADLARNRLPLHTVSLPQAGKGNALPDSPGATLVVVYRDPAQPLRKIVLYDGLYIATQGTVATQTIRGFYQSSTPGSATLTHIAGSGAGNLARMLRFNDAPVASSSFRAASNPPDRSWGHVTADVSALMSRATTSPEYGETVVSAATNGNSTPYRCFSLAATIFSTAVLDADHDGIPDRLEQPGGPLKDPNGVALPDLYAMGARADHKDFFVEVNAMRTVQDTTYGSPAAPYDSSATPPVPSVTAPPHNHMPAPDVIRMVGDALRDSPLTNPDGTTGIRAHVDVGDIAAYHGLGAGYAPSVGTNDSYLVPSALARGGELTEETACDAAEPTCRFPDYPGTVGWGFSLTRYMLDTFDRNRNGLFHYLLYAHSRGKAKASDPESGDFHVPTSSSGVADLPGFRAIVSLGRWDNFTGTPYIQAATTMHELVAHNGEIWHGGAPPVITSTPKGVVKLIEPNCKPNYLSVANYAFQLRGLLDDAGNLHVDLSRGKLSDIAEGALNDRSLAPTPQYRPAWYAPLVPGSLGEILGAPAAKKFCNGLSFDTAGLIKPSLPMARIEASSTSAEIDWDALGLGHRSDAQDVNLNGTPADTLRGFNDWAALRLDQMSGGHLMGDVSSGGQDFGGQDFGGQDFGGQDFGGQDFGGQDFGGQDFGGQDFGGQDFGGLDFDGQDFGGQDFGGQDFGGDGELTYEDAVAVAGAAGLPPNAFTACVLGGTLPGPRPGVGTPACEDASSPLHRTLTRWTAPNLGTAVLYHVLRGTGATITGATPVVEVGAPTPAEAGCAAPGQVCSFVDTEELPDGQAFTYFVRADFGDGSTSGASTFGTIVARNDAPIALADARSANEDTVLLGTVAAASHVLANDSDADSAALTPVLVAGTTHGTLAFNADGSFAYTPGADFNGTDSFTYRLLAGVWSGPPSVPLSADSGLATVTIAVHPANDAPVANAATASTDEDTALDITLSGSDLETSAGALSGAIVHQPAHGALAGEWPNYTYTPDPDYNGADSFTFVVTDRGDPDGCAGAPPACAAPLTSAEADVSLTINPVADAAPLTILTLALPNGTDGAEYSQTLFASGGVEPYSWDIVPIPDHSEFALPVGLLLSPDGVIHGLPDGVSVEGRTFRVRVTDAAGHEATQDLCIHVDPSPTEGSLTATAAADTLPSTIDAIAQTLAGESVDISDVTFTGAAAALGTFTGGFPATGLSSGIILSSGAVESVNGSNTSDSTSLNNGGTGDLDLDPLVGATVYDPAVLEFNFTVTDPAATVVKFEYVFASEEYNEFANTGYNDVFGFFMEGPGFPRANLALIPGTGTPVSINTVNGGNPIGTGAVNPEYYVNNDADDGGTRLTLTQADGLTKVLTVQATIVPGLTYHLKLAIADAGDHILDSWVLLKTSSFSTVCPLIP